MYQVLKDHKETTFKDGSQAYRPLDNKSSAKTEIKHEGRLQATKFSVSGNAFVAKLLSWS
jgi:hypothetical protein